MKRVSQMTALAMALGLACASSWAAELAKPLTLGQLQQQNGKAIDTRPSAFYNGWPQTLNGPSGHEPAALNLSASWLDKMSTEQLNAWIKQHNLKTDAPVALYGNDKDVDAVKTRLQKAGLTHISILSDALSEPSRLQKLPHFEQLVYPQWLHDLQQGKEVTAKPAGDWKVIEAAWGAPKLYLISHIPGADYIDTNEVESEPLWNKVSDEQLKAMLAKHGIRHDTTVILYGRDVYAAARVAQIMLYAGVKDVRLLDGGWQTWSDAGLPVERGTPPKVKAEPDFGVKIPAQPQLMLDMEQARGLLHRQDASLVSIRSWPEFIGTTSGYSYIKPKGEIAGARWGHAGSDSTHMEDFHNPDGTMRSADDITAMWKAWNIKPEQQVSFYCGTGWRASETFMYARAMGWKNVSVYDGGWYEWTPSAVIYMRRTGEYGAGNQALMDTFKKWVRENNLYDKDTVIYAVPMDNPEKTEPCHCRYDVCINRPQNQKYAPNQVKCRELEGGKYLVFLIPHTTDAVQTAWQMCFSELEKLGYLPDETRPVMERYKKRLVDEHYCELCMPVL